MDWKQRHFIGILRETAPIFEELPDLVIRQLMETAVPPARVCFALNERDALGHLPEAIDLMARREKVILDAAKGQDFTLEKLRAALEKSDTIKQ